MPVFPVTLPILKMNPMFLYHSISFEGIKSQTLKFKSKRCTIPQNWKGRINNLIDECVFSLKKREPGTTKNVRLSSYIICN